MAAKNKKKIAASKRTTVKKLTFNWKLFPSSHPFQKGTEFKAIFGGSMQARIPQEFGLILFPDFSQRIFRASVSKHDTVNSVEQKLSSELAGLQVKLIHKESKLLLDNEMGMEELFLIKEHLSVMEKVVEKVDDVPPLVGVKDELIR